MGNYGRRSGRVRRRRRGRTSARRRLGMRWVRRRRRGVRGTIARERRAHDNIGMRGSGRGDDTRCADDDDDED
eukprot:8255091-Pyramimonas_sp.AAC.1